MSRPTARCGDHLEGWRPLEFRCVNHLHQRGPARRKDCADAQRPVDVERCGSFASARHRAPPIVRMVLQTMANIGVCRQKSATPTNGFGGSSGTITRLSASATIPPDKTLSASTEAPTDAISPPSSTISSTVDQPMNPRWYSCRIKPACASCGGMANPATACSEKRPPYTQWSWRTSARKLAVANDPLAGWPAYRRCPSLRWQSENFSDRSGRSHRQNPRTPGASLRRRLQLSRPGWHDGCSGSATTLPTKAKPASTSPKLN